MNVKAAAQAVAWLLNKSDEHSEDRLKMQKLLYLADRECMDRTGFPITNDTYCHQANGPVLCQTLELMGGRARDDDWDRWVRCEGPDENTQQISLQADNVHREKLNYLSDYEIGILDEIWEEFGKRSGQALSDYTHDLPEHVSVKEGCTADLGYADILMALGYDKKSAGDQATEIASA